MDLNSDEHLSTAPVLLNIKIPLGILQILLKMYENYKKTYGKEEIVSFEEYVGDFVTRECKEIQKNSKAGMKR